MKLTKESNNILFSHYAGVVIGAVTMSCVGYFYQDKIIPMLVVYIFIQTFLTLIVRKIAFKKEQQC